MGCPRPLNRFPCRFRRRLSNISLVVIAVLCFIIKVSAADQREMLEKQLREKAAEIEKIKAECEAREAAILKRAHDEADRLVASLVKWPCDRLSVRLGLKRCGQFFFCLKHFLKIQKSIGSKGQLELCDCCRRLLLRLKLGKIWPRSMEL